LNNRQITDWELWPFLNCFFFSPSDRYVRSFHRIHKYIRYLSVPVPPPSTHPCQFSCYSSPGFFAPGFLPLLRFQDWGRIFPFCLQRSLSPPPCAVFLKNFVSVSLLPSSHFPRGRRRSSFLKESVVSTRFSIYFHQVCPGSLHLFPSPKATPQSVFSLHPLDWIFNSIFPLCFFLDDIRSCLPP